MDTHHTRHRPRWLIILVMALSALTLSLTSGATTAHAAAVPLNHPMAQPASALKGCPSGAKLLTPSQQSIAKYGAQALIPDNMPQARKAASHNSTVKRFASRKIHWLTHDQCHITRQQPATAIPSTRRAPTSHKPLATSNAAQDQLMSIPNWSGYETGTASTSGTNSLVGMIENVSMEWSVPTQVSSDDSNDSIAAWPGIGQGQGSNYLVQAGTTSQQFDVLGVKTHNDYAWYQERPNGPNVNTFSVNPGDQIISTVSYDPSSSDADFVVEDATSGVASDVEQAVPGTPGNNADWIVERPSILGIYQQLGDFDTENISGATGIGYNNGTAQTFSVGDTDAAPAEVMMVNCADNDILATPSAIDSTGEGFSVFWNDYGPETDSC